jgi:hypothetical protein
LCVYWLVLLILGVIQIKVNFLDQTVWLEGIGGGSGSITAGNVHAVLFIFCGVAHVKVQLLDGVCCEGLGAAPSLVEAIVGHGGN